MTLHERYKEIAMLGDYGVHYIPSNDIPEKAIAYLKSRFGVHARKVDDRRIETYCPHCGR